MDCLCDEEWMRLALEEAEKAGRAGEVPIGAVIVRNGEVIARAHNLCETNACATAHAELLAIEAACKTVGHWRLEDCTLYTTLEPCPMCAGAIINARMQRVVYAAKDARMGACGSMMNLSSYPLPCKPQLANGIGKEKSLALLRGFFADLRKKREK